MSIIKFLSIYLFYLTFLMAFSLLKLQIKLGWFVMLMCGTTFYVMLMLGKTDAADDSITIPKPLAYILIILMFAFYFIYCPHYAK